MACTVVLDVGKTLSKLTLWTSAGALLARRTRPNAGAAGPGYRALDAAGIEAWMIEGLRAFAATAPVARIVPVAHGAAAALVRDGTLAMPPVDYESPVPEPSRRAYDAQRDPFALTGSPALPGGLNLGAQLHHLQALDAGALRGAALLLWPQYWAWVLSGVAAAEVTSLGCHTDLWRPAASEPSGLAHRRGWTDMLPPLRPAADVLGQVRPEIAERTGLPPDTVVHCGLHDSNAALLAARGFPELPDEPTLVSTGTWFVAMRPIAGDGVPHLPERRDCLLNVDVHGRPVPSARFMGGREIAELVDAPADSPADQPALLAAAQRVLGSGAMALPSFAPGCGPFPAKVGRWRDPPADPHEGLAAACLYAALVADVSLELIDARGPLLIEGRFARAEVFTRSLAAMRGPVFAAGDVDVSFGALRLAHPALRPSGELTAVRALEGDLGAYRTRWRAAADPSMVAA